MCLQNQTSLVSIPCGTIKRPPSEAQRFNIFMFQFLVVQLRDVVLNRQYIVYHVSIPCGTIKRNYIYFSVRTYEVSIPCGTIKRHSLLNIALSVTSFQFLVVQLRVLGIRRRYGSDVVSIPCGTIKSVFWNFAGAQEGRFQFLVVQLRVLTHRMDAQICKFQFLVVQLRDKDFPQQFTVPKFQFLVVQLRDLCRRYSTYNSTSFNSLWYN